MAASSRQLDMTVGSPEKNIIMYAIPIACGSLLSCLYGTMDSVIVGRFVGSNALAAVGATMQINGLLTTVISSLTSAFSVLAAQAFGAKKPELVHKVVVCALYVVAVSAVIMLGIGTLFARPLMRLLQTAPEILDDASAYLQITIALIGGELVYNGVTSIIRAAGDSKTPLYFLILSSILNVVLNLFFVLLLHMGVPGVAWATVISQHICAMVAVVYTWIKYPIFRFGVADLKPDWRVMKETIILGVTGSLQYVATRVGDVIISARINSFGAAAMAAFTTVSQITRYVFTIFMALANGMSVFTGQNIGAGKVDRVKKSFGKILLFAICIALVGLVLMAIFGKLLIGIFISKADSNYANVMAESWKYLMIFSCGFPFLSAIWMFNNSLRGMGEAMIILYSGLVEVVFKLAGALLLSKFIGTTGLWLASPVGWIFGIIPSAVYYFSFRWVQKGSRLKNVT